MNETGLEVVRFRWDVPNKGYVWLEDASTLLRLDAEKGMITSDPDMYLIINPKSELVRRYDPLSMDPPLWSRFVCLDPDPISINGFVNEYGWLGIGKWIIPPGEKTKKEMPTGEDLRTWKKEIETFKQAHQVWEWMEKKEAGKLGQVIIWKTSSVIYQHDDRGWFLIASKGKYPEIFNTWKRGSLYAPAKFYLLQIVNEKLKKAHPRLLLDKKGNLKEYIYPSNLLTSMWYEFSQALSGQRKLRRCEICGEYMDVTDSRSNKKQHKWCGNNERYFRMKARSFYEQGMNFEEVAQKVNKPLGWVKDLLEEGR